MSLAKGTPEIDHNVKAPPEHVSDLDAPLKASATRTDNYMRGKEVQHGEGSAQQIQPAIQGAYQGMRFPQKYIPYDERDDIYQIKKDMPPQVQRVVTLGDEDVKYMLDKKKARDEVDFRAWIQEYVSKSNDPVLLRYFEEHFPEVFEGKVKYISDTAELQKRLALIKIRGPREREDWMLIYALQKGIINIPDWPVHMSDRQALLGQDSGFRRGYFNPLRYTTSDINDPAVKNSALALPLAPRGGDFAAGRILTGGRDGSSRQFMNTFAPV